MSLILTRRINETIVIGDDVKVSVIGVKGTQVRLAIEAPEGVSVHREEIYNRIQAQAGRGQDWRAQRPRPPRKV